MKKDDKRQTITLVLGGLAAVTAALLGLVVTDVPNSLKSLVGSPLAWAVVVTCTLPILILLMVNQVSALLKSSSDREATVEDVVKHLPVTSTIIHFETSAAAMEYLIENVARATHVYNTRLSIKRVEDSDPENLRLVARFDAAVWKAVQRGMEYSWLVSTEYAQIAKDLEARRKAYAQTHRSVGVYCYWILKESEVPFFHFVVLQYSDHRELLLGWALASTHSFGERVFLLRDDRLVDYFRGLFDTYSRAATGGNTLP